MVTDMSKSDNDKSKKTRRIDVDAINKNVHKLDEKMAKDRREFLIKQARSEQSAAKIILNA